MAVRRDRQRRRWYAGDRPVSGPRDFAPRSRGGAHAVQIDDEVPVSLTIATGIAVSGSAGAALAVRPAIRAQTEWRARSP